MRSRPARALIGDTLYGGDGADPFYGKAGLDTMTGGGAADTYVFETGSAFCKVDVITDFSTGDGDVLDLTTFLSSPTIR